MLSKDQMEELKQYKELLDSGVITEDEFNAKKEKLLGDTKGSVQGGQESNTIAAPPNMNYSQTGQVQDSIKEGKTVVELPKTTMAVQPKKKSNILPIVIAVVAGLFILGVIGMLIGGAGSQGDLDPADKEVAEENDDADNKEAENEEEDADSDNDNGQSEKKSNKKQEEIDNATTGEKEALTSAMSYLEYSAFSKKGLIAQLKFEKYSSSEAKFAVNHCGANWKKQAVRHAKQYLENQSFSKKGLIDQLKFEKYTSNQAKYGADHCKANWKKQAVKKAESYLDLMSFSRQELYDQLVFDGFTADQAQYGVNKALK